MCRSCRQKATYCLRIMLIRHLLRLAPRSEVANHGHHHSCVLLQCAQSAPFAIPQRSSPINLSQNSEPQTPIKTRAGSTDSSGCVSHFTSTPRPSKLLAFLMLGVGQRGMRSGCMRGNMMAVVVLLLLLMVLLLLFVIFILWLQVSEKDSSNQR